MTLTTEQLSQIKADIAARKAMPEYGESVEGNIERLRVIGETRSHFSTETVEMLVQALEEKSRALADAERERDDWVEHSRKMEHRAIEAEGKLANREAQPVALVDRRPAASGSICWQNGGKDLPHGTELFTAPPAPAVPDDVQRDAERWRAMLGSARIRILGSAGFDATALPGGDPDYRHFGMEIWTHYPGWLTEKNEYGIDILNKYADACRAAMLAQPVSKRYTLNSPEIPDGWKLVPLAPTNKMILAAMGVDGCSSSELKGAYQAMLAAAPEGGNGA
ncbi:hypothetical protein ACEWN4_000159 [Serratia marcescens]